MMVQSQTILSGQVSGPLIATDEALSFWGGVDPTTAQIIDIHHPLHGVCLTGAILVMPTSRGSCTGSGVLLEMILNGRGPGALIFRESEDVLTLGALIAAEMFETPIPVLRLSPDAYETIAASSSAIIGPGFVKHDTGTLAVSPPEIIELELTDEDEAMLAGLGGMAVSQSMRIICRMAAQQGAKRLVDVTQAHIDGCIYASPANLTFADRMADMGAKVRIPTTMNAISVDHSNWRAQGVPATFGDPAARLADAYVTMGCQPTFTCSPYLLDTAPQRGDSIAWAESNAVIFANTVLGARTAKHPDFLDLCIALTGRAPESGVYLSIHRRAQRVIDIEMPDNVDDAFWPLIGYLAGKTSPDRIPLLRGINKVRPSRDDMKALCAAFGTTSAAPMLHIEGITPESDEPLAENADHSVVSRAELVQAWTQLNSGPREIDLVAIGSPHASLQECRNLAQGLKARLGTSSRRPDVSVIVTAGQKVIEDAKADGTIALLKDAGVLIYPDLCWCSISEPVFPSKARALMTNSGKYAHYGPGLSGRPVRFGSLSQCIEAAVTGHIEPGLPTWLQD